MSYRINEIFYSLQGEGFHTGCPAVFVRFAGCNRQCDFCDTDFHAYTVMNLDDIIAAVNAYPTRHVILTGGEPTLQVDNVLVDALHAVGKFIHIETNGSRSVPSGIDWVTCSPKTPPYNIDRLDELKIVYQGDDRHVEQLYNLFNVENCYLQPCSGQNIEQTINYIKAHPHWRLSLQTHKLINIP